MRVWNFQRTISSLTVPSFNHLLQLCNNSRSLNPGKQTHQQIIIQGLHHNPFVITKLILFYADCNDIETSRILFDRLPQPNVFAWTSLISFYSRNGMFDECIGAYIGMKSKNVLPDGYVFPKVLRACTMATCLGTGVQIQKDVIQCGAESNIEVCNCLIDMYSKSGYVESARQVFDSMAGTDLLSWNSMISGYVYNGILQMPVEMLGLMRLNSIEPDTVTWNSVMDAYCRMGQCDEAWKIFSQIEEPSIISWTTLISGYSRTGKHESALGIFRDMISRGVHADLDCISSILPSCQHMVALRFGQEIHAYGTKMDYGCAFYKSPGPALLMTYAKCGRIHDAERVFRLMDKRDVVAWNAMILGYGDRGMGNLAVRCFQEMQRMGIKGDQTTFSTILPACGLKSGKQIHAYIKKGSFASATPVWNALIHMYAQCGSITTAYSVFCQMDNKDLVSWNTMIGGFGKHGLGREALQLLQEMRNSGIRPNSFTFTSVLSACSYSGLTDEGLEIYNNMTQIFELNPGMEHYACLIDLLARAGRVEDALEFIMRMPVAADKRVWGSVLAASLSYQKISVAIVASEHLVELEPENAGHYVTLSNMYSRVGRVDDAVKIRKLMESTDLAKQIGLSWVVNGN
ncbi:pentatricopeptide repeat-containing protein DOT4, chloroplastic-like [Olea europaea var. sylvestris]|uniref:pentatricopeptide repeat-containing protein DOT4, chloroplastic-like n=1 Tax=Olea europaea var. sylvestris TaxID=158386 RepID=UPI000C1D66EF|nr:pentatricopeptide repeat-containing protein DOT4, chloroplastic-like [Olea europaea var. sylvestris]